MRTRNWGRAGWCLALAALISGAQAIEFVEPAGGAVRGSVPVRVDLGAGNQTGFVVFYVGAAGQPLRFRLATVADPDGLFGFQWDTQSQEARLPDGEYRLLAVGYNAAGEPLGQTALTVEVQNQVPASQIPDRGIQLRYNLTPGRDAQYLAESKINVSGGGSGDDKVDVGSFGGGLRAWWRWRVLWRNANGTAYVRDSFLNFAALSGGGQRSQLGATGDHVSYLMKSDGEIVPRAEAIDEPSPSSHLTIEFPSRPVKIGDTWRSAMRVLIEPRSGRTDLVPGRHTLTGIEWHAGFRTAVIDSEFEGGPYALDLEDQRDTPKEFVRVLTTVQGKRRTYFAYQPEVGRVLRVEETQAQHCTAQWQEQQQAQMGMGMDGMAPGMMPGMAPGMAPMAEGTMPPGMPPGAGAPGMPGAIPGAIPGAMPGMDMGMGMGMGMTAEPPKVKVVTFTRNIKTDIYQDFARPTR